MVDGPCRQAWGAAQFEYLLAAQTFHEMDLVEAAAARIVHPAHIAVLNHDFAVAAVFYHIACWMAVAAGSVQAIAVVDVLDSDSLVVVRTVAFVVVLAGTHQMNALGD